jgi:hypothetical protein
MVPPDGNRLAERYLVRFGFTLEEMPISPAAERERLRTD